MSQVNHNLTKAQERRRVRKLVLSRRGAAAQIAAELCVRPSAVTLVLQGKSTSERIWQAARDMAATIAREVA